MTPTAIRAAKLQHELERVRRELLAVVELLNIDELRRLRGILADTAMVIDAKLAPAMPVDDVPHAVETER